MRRCTRNRPDSGYVNIAFICASSECRLYNCTTKSKSVFSWVTQGDGDKGTSVERKVRRRFCMSNTRVLLGETCAYEVARTNSLGATPRGSFPIATGIEQTLPR